MMDYKRLLESANGNVPPYVGYKRYFHNLSLSRTLKNVFTLLWRANVVTGGVFEIIHLHNSVKNIPSDRWRCKGFRVEGYLLMQLFSLHFLPSHKRKIQTWASLSASARQRWKYLQYSPPEICTWTPANLQTLKFPFLVADDPSALICPLRHAPSNQSWSPSPRQQPHTVAESGRCLRRN